MFSRIASQKSVPPKQSIVLDLDETLVHTFIDGGELTPEIKDSPECKQRIYSVQLPGKTYWGLKRPYTDEFLDYVYTRFDGIGVWSAGIEEYVRQIVEQLNVNLHFEYNRDHCDVVTSGKETVMWKPLNAIFDTHSSHFSRFNTWVVDDREDYAKDNLLNWVKIPPYNPSLATAHNYQDDYLPRLVEWFETSEVKHAANILEVVKEWY